MMFLVLNHNGKIKATIVLSPFKVDADILLVDTMIEFTRLEDVSSLITRGRCVSVQTK